jgi:hypothetical protein
LMNRDDMIRLGFAENDCVSAATVSEDGQPRELDGLRVHAYDIPAGCVMGYYPECNRLIPLAHHAKRSKVPAAKAIPVRLRASPSVSQQGM